jgi:hypothetical protein
MHSSMLKCLAMVALASHGAMASPLAVNAADCTGDFLKAAPDTLLAAQTAGSPDTLLKAPAS